MCVAIQKFWKKVGKTSQKLFFGPNLHRKEVIMGHTQDGKFFLAGRSSAFRKFLFYQNTICFDWVMNLFLSWVMFSVQKSVISSENSCAITIEGVRKCNSALPWYTTVKPVVKHGYFWPCWAAWHFAPPFFHGQTIWSRLMVKKD